MLEALEPVAATASAWRRDILWGVRRATPKAFKGIVRAVGKRVRARSAGDAAAPPVGEGSFAALVAETNAWLAARLEPASVDLHRSVIWKNDQKRLADTIGLDVAQTYLSEVTLDDALAYVESAGLERFAIKPVWSRNSIGFHGLVRARSTGIYRDVTTGGFVRLAALRRLLRREYAPLGREDRWMLEELLLPVEGGSAPVANYKFMCFGGRADIVFQRAYFGDRRRPFRQIYDRDWNLVRMRVGKKLAPVARAPLNGSRLQAYAERAASALAFPFIRIDLYDTSRGVVLGEFTPGPGSLHKLEPEWDEHFRDLWLEAAQRIEGGAPVGDLRAPHARSGRRRPGGRARPTYDRSVTRLAGEPDDRDEHRPVRSGPSASWLDVVAADAGTLRSELVWVARRIAPASVKQRIRRLLDPSKKHRRAVEAARKGTEGSFGTQIDQSMTWLREHLPAASAELHCDVVAKASQKRLARRLGVDVTTSYLERVPLAEAIDHVRRTGLDRFAIKPDLSRSAIGFRSIVRRGPIYLDLRRGAGRRLGMLERELRREFAPLRRRDEWILEELLLPADGSERPLDDYKIMCFGGRVEFTYQKAFVGGRKTYRKQFYDRDWSPVSAGLKDYGTWTRVPESAQEMIELAEEIASQLCYPFIRIDLYDTSRGLVLGEFTPFTGGRHTFNDTWNARMLRRWHEASAELEEGLRTGRVQPLMPEGADAAPAGTPTEVS